MPVKHRILVIGIALVCVAIYLYTAAPFMLWLDAPRFVAAIVTLGISVPPEPLYVFLAHFFTYLPFASVVFRIQIFSALLAGGSLILLYRLVTRILSDFVRPLKQNQAPLKHPPLLISGIFSMLTLAFSYQFWSQAQNVETFILDCFIELVVLNLLLSNIASNKVFFLFSCVAFLCGLATGTNPVIASIFPSILLTLWGWKATLGTKRIVLLGLFGLLGVLIIYSYIPLMGMRRPFLNETDSTTIQGIWDLATGQGKNVYRPEIGRINGFTGSPTVFLTSVWHFVVMLWMDFTPVVLPFVFLGGVYLWLKQRRIFSVLILVVISNVVLSGLYLSGNQESWFLQSDVIFAIFSGMGYLWLTQLLAKLFPHLNFRIQRALLLLIALTPLIYWWPTLNRHTWKLTQDYIDNLYSPIQEPAILVGAGDVFDAVSYYMHDVTGIKHSVIPITDNSFYLFPWYRIHLLAQTQIMLPGNLHPTFSSPDEYSQFMNDFFAKNLPKYRIYMTRPALENNFFPRADGSPSFLLDTERFALIPSGLVWEVVAKNKKQEISTKNFAYHFSTDFPQTLPFYLENIYNAELQDTVNEYALSYDSVGHYFLDGGLNNEALIFFLKAHQFNPKNVRILKDLGIYFTKQRRYEKALDYFKQANDIKPNDEEILFDIAQTDGNLGKIDEEKKELENIVDNYNSQTSSNFEQMAAEQLTKLNQLPTTPQQDIRSKPAPAQLLPGRTHFTNDHMNLQFVYPHTLQVTQDDPQMVSLSDPSHNNAAEKMLIYSATNTDINNLQLPFPVIGTLSQTQPVQFPEFTATMKIYISQAAEIEQLLFLQHDQQIFVIRFPANKALDPLVVNQVLQSIRTIH